jgi:hypothetical protein
MQHRLDNLVAALGIVGVLGGVPASFYMVYQSAMIAVCYYRDTTPDQRAHTRLTYRPSSLPNEAKLHHRKAIKGMVAFFGFFLLAIAANYLLPN